MEQKTDMNLDKYKKQNIAGPKTDMNVTKCKKLNMMEHKTDMDITKIDKYKNNLTAILPQNTKMTWI